MPKARVNFTLVEIIEQKRHLVVELDIPTCESAEEYDKVVRNLVWKTSPYFMYSEEFRGEEDLTLKSPQISSLVVLDSDTDQILYEFRDADKDFPVLKLDYQELSVLQEEGGTENRKEETN